MADDVIFLIIEFFFENMEIFISIITDQSKENSMLSNFFFKKNLTFRVTVEKVKKATRCHK